MTEIMSLMPALGEDLTYPQKYNEGLIPAVMVLPAKIGSGECLSTGELVAQGIPFASLIDGFPAGCVVTQGELDDLWAEVSSIETCAVQRMYAYLMLCTYADDLPAAQEAVNDWLGPVPIVALLPHTGVRNGVLTITTSQWQVGIIDGTRNFQELALQAFNGIYGPQDVGGYSSSFFWRTSSNYVNDRLQAQGLAPGYKICLVGHSYGGAVVANLVARYVLGNTLNEIAYLTFGCPKVGDARLQNLLLQTRGINIVNDDDIVTALPPDAITLAPLLGIFAVPNLLFYPMWRRPMPQATLSPAGFLEVGDNVFLETQTLFNFISNAINKLPDDPVTGHYTSSYYARLQTRCPEPEWPVSTDAYEVTTIPLGLLRLTSKSGTAKGGIVFNSPASLIPPTPGTTCADALDITFPYSGTWDLEYNVYAWFRLPAPVGFYRGKLQLNSGSIVVADFLTGSSCATSLLFYTLGGNQCADFLVGVDFVWIRVATLDVLGANITLYVDNGTCP